MNTSSLIKNLDLHSKGVWFSITIAVVLLLIVLFMPKKRISWRESFFVFGTIGYIALLADLAVYNTLDLFDLGNKNIEGLGDIMSFAVVPSCLAVLFLNFVSLEKRWLGVILFTTLSFLFEWTMVRIGYMKLHGWHTWWSIPFYIVMFGWVIPWIFKFLKTEQHEWKKKEVKDFTLGKREKVK